MSFENLPGTIVNKLDGNLATATPQSAPIVLVVGTAERGDPTKVFRAVRPSDAIKEFGKSGTLARGMLEALGGGASNVRLLRIGAKPARLHHFIASQVEIATVETDRSLGDNYTVSYVASTGRLKITRALDGVVVYDATAGVVLGTEDGGDDVSVTGTWSAGQGINITAGTALSAVPTTDTTAFYQDGTDGTDLTRTEIYEELDRAYDLLRDQPFDMLVPMDVYLDDSNIADMTDAQIAAAGISATTSGFNILGKVFTQEFEGQKLYWWTFGKNSNYGEIFPEGYGSATATKDAYGVNLTTADFHEVNFAYQLARFCFEVSEQDQECHGTIGVKPPLSTSLKDLAAWVGKLPVYDSTTGLISTNGTGLLGNKFMSGRKVNGDVPGFPIDGVSGTFNGGFINTDDGFLDSDQLKDDNDKLVDIGKYLSVLSAQPLFSNAVSSSYTSSAAAVYAGMIADLPVESAPTNKVIDSVGLTFNINLSKVDLLAGQRYVHFSSRPKGIVVADAPTAARPDSDYTRLTTNRIVKAAVDAVRLVADPFLGEGLSGARMAALDTAIEQVLTKLQKAGILKRYSKVLSATPEQAVLGQATVDLTLVPAYELRQITVHVSLAAQ